MTIEEYLNKRIEDLEEGSCNSSLVQGKILAYREILSKLSEMEHEVTLREVKDFCAKQKEEADVDENPCEHCPMSIEVQYLADSEPSIECGHIAPPPSLLERRRNPEAHEGGPQ